MATTVAGNRITGHIGLTCWADDVIAEGLLVELVGPYKVAIPAGANSTKLLGHVIVANRAGGIQNNLTVESYGMAVSVLETGEAIDVGEIVTADTAGKVVATTTLHAAIGIALTPSGAAGNYIDVLNFR